MKLRYALFVSFCIFLCFLPFINSAHALLLGIAGAIIFKKPLVFNEINGLLLKSSIVLLGFGLNWSDALSTSKSGLFLTAGTVVCTLLIGVAIGKMMKLEHKTNLLISIGTAICGGSAIAAVAPAIRPSNDQFAISLLVVFFLNALSLLIFPFAGQLLNLDQTTFGSWVAISIHDTSSVVGAAAMYGNEALEVATTMKLTRALWIIPLVIGLNIFDTKAQAFNYRKLPWFILLFILAICVANSFPQRSLEFGILSWLGTKTLVVSLFFVGTNFSLDKIKKMGSKSLLFGLTLWIIVSIVSLFILA
ncbi:MAG: putative sulfate exporter family transporter [Ekhidna sp.]